MSEGHIFCAAVDRWSGETLRRPLFAAGGIAGIILGIAGIAYANRTSERLRSSAAPGIGAFDGGLTPRANVYHAYIWPLC